LNDISRKSDASKVYATTGIASALYIVYNGSTVFTGLDIPIGLKTFKYHNDHQDIDGFFILLFFAYFDILFIGIVNDDPKEKQFIPLNSDKLLELQTSFANVIQLFLEEISMLTPGVLGYVDYR
jgi:hypothetical protein